MVFGGAARMPFNNQSGRFERVWNFVDQRETGDDITRTDLDVMANDLANGITDVAALHLQYVGEWNPEIASFPASRPNGGRILARDAFVATAGGTVGGVTFDIGETLVALVPDPGQTYAARWLRLPFLSLPAMMSVADAAQGYADRVDLGALDAAVVATGLDRTATAADRVQTGLDRAATGSDVATTAAAVSAAQAARDAAALNAKNYASTAAAQADAGLTAGSTYSVVSGTEIVYYRKDSGAASTELFRLLANHIARPIGIRTSGTTPPYWPDLNTTTQVLTIPADCVLQLPRAPQYYVVPTTVNIDTTNGGVLTTTARNVYFRTDTSTFEVKAWNTALSYAETLTHNLVAIIRRVAPTTVPEINTLEMGCKCTVDSIVSANQPGVLCPIILPATAGYIPNLDSAANTLYIPGDIIIKSSGAVGGKAGSYAVATGATIDLSVATSSAKAVYRSISGAAYVVKDHNAVLTGPEVSDLLLVAVLRRTASSGQHLTMACTCSVDSRVQGPGIGETYTDWAAIYTPLTGATNATNLPNYNQSANTLTFYADTILQHGDREWVIPTNQVVAMSVSSASRVWWDTATNTLVCRAWNSANLTDAERKNFVLVASIRDADGVLLGAAISMMCPYRVNGRVFGLFAPDGSDLQARNRHDDALVGIMHRGYSSIAPENTLAAYKSAAAAQRYVVEGDIQWTSDGYAVLLHDATINRTSNGTGAIAGMSLATARTYDFGAWKAAAFTGEQIPTWADWLYLAKQINLYGYFEIKTDASLPQVQGLISDVAKAGMQKRVQFDSFYLTALQKCTATDAAQDVGYLVGVLDDAGWTAAIAAAVTLKTSTNRVAIEPSTVGLTKARVEEAHLAGIRVVVYTVNVSADVLTVAAMGVDGIMTDSLNIAQTIRDGRL